MANLIGYVVVTADGRLKTELTGKVHPKNPTNATLFSNASRAQAFARDDGDAVVVVEIALDKEPRFIRRKVM